MTRGSFPHIGRLSQGPLLSQGKEPQLAAAFCEWLCGAVISPGQPAGEPGSRLGCGELRFASPIGEFRSQILIQRLCDDRWPAPFARSQDL